MEHWYNSTVAAWLLVVAASINSCIGNLLLKRSREGIAPAGLFELLTNPWLIGGLVFYAANVLLFAKSLDRLPVSTAYPALAGGSFLLLALGSRYFLGETFALSQWLGLCMVLGGITLLGRIA